MDIGKWALPYGLGSKGGHFSHLPVSVRDFKQWVVTAKAWLSDEQIFVMWLHNVVLLAKGLLSCEIMAFLSDGMATQHNFYWFSTALELLYRYDAPCNFIIFVPRTLTAHSSSRIIIKSLIVGIIVAIYSRNFGRIISSHCFVTVIVASCCRDLVAIWVGSIVAICRRDNCRNKISGEHKKINWSLYCHIVLS